MKLVTLTGLNPNAKDKINRYGNLWKVMGVYSRVDTQYFDGNEPYMYLVPNDPTTPRNLGAMWVKENNDPDYSVAVKS